MSTDKITVEPYKKIYDFLVSNKNLPVSKWPWTEEKYNRLIEDFETRKERFPLKKKFIRDEIRRLKKAIPTNDITTGFLYGVEMFDNGKDNSCERLYWHLVANNLDFDKPNDDLCLHLLQIAEGYATKNFFYYLKAIKKNSETGAKKSKKTKSLSEDDSNLYAQKIPWHGTPGEFGAIMSPLIENGFVPLVTDLKKTVRFLEKFFDVRNEKGLTVSSDYLYKCFSEKKKSFFPSELKIPVSENLSK